MSPMTAAQLKRLEAVESALAAKPLHSHAAPPTTVYGPAIATDGKDNRIIGWTVPGRECAFLWRSTGGQLTGLAVNQRFGPDGNGYSQGDGGLLRITIEGVTNGIPNGTVLGSVTYDPVNPGTNSEDKRVIPLTANIPAGLVAAVFRNVHADPTRNWMSLNVLWQGNPDTPRQPAFPDGDMAVLSRHEYGSAWSVVRSNTPVFAAVFTDHHEGQAYHERFVPPQEIDGAARVRERFTPPKALNVVAVWFRVLRKSGTTLTVQLAGKTVNTDISGVPVSIFAQGVWLGGKWIRTPLAVSLPANVEQAAEFSAADIRVPPIRKTYGTDNPFWLSRQFTEGVAEKYVNGSWQGMYSNVADLQFYLETTDDR